MGRKNGSKRRLSLVHSIFNIVKNLERHLNYQNYVQILFKTNKNSFPKATFYECISQLMSDNQLIMA